MKNLRLAFSLIVFLILVNVVNSNVFAQENPVRLGVKIGFPQVAGLNLEYVTPLLNKRLAFDVDYSYIPLKPSEGTLKYTYYAVYADYYFNHEGHGFYGGFGYSRIGLKVTKDVTFSDGTTQSGNADIGINALNLKIGGKYGKGIYFRWELGGSLALNSPVFEVVATKNGVTDTKSFKSPFKGNGPLADIGFGFSL
jgi:hypothetical protein